MIIPMVRITNTVWYALFGDTDGVTSYTMPIAAWEQAGKPNKIQIKVFIDD